MKRRRDSAFVATILDDIRPHMPAEGPLAMRYTRFAYRLAGFSGVHALVVFRCSQLFTRTRLIPLSYVCRKVLYHVYHVDAWGSMELGGGHWWCHALGVVYSRHARIGRRVQVFQHVSVVGTLRGSPVIEDFVILFAGACIVGDVCVGRGAVIGAQAVVTHDVPPYAVMVGNPATVLRERWLEEVDSEDKLGLAMCRAKGSR